MVATRIGSRVVEMRKNAPDLLSYDPKISAFYEELDLLQEAIDERLDETCDEDMSCSAV